MITVFIMFDNLEPEILDAGILIGKERIQQ